MIINTDTRKRPFQTIDWAVLLLLMQVRAAILYTAVGVDAVKVVVDFAIQLLLLLRLFFRRRERIRQGQSSPHALMGR